MKTLKKFIFGLCLVASAFLGVPGPSVNADSNDDIERFFSESVETTMVNPDIAVVRAPLFESLELKTFFLRIQASFGFQVPLFASAKIIPEIEFVFER